MRLSHAQRKLAARNAASALERAYGKCKFELESLQAKHAALSAALSEDEVLSRLAALSPALSDLVKGSPVDPVARLPRV